MSFTTKRPVIVIKTLVYGDKYMNSCQQANVIRRTMEFVGCLALVFGLIICGGRAQAKPGVTQNEGVSRWHIVDYVLSPDGNKLAELVRVHARDRSYTKVVIRDLNNVALSPRTVFAGADLSSVVWVSDRTIAFIELGAKNWILMEDVRGDHVTRLFDTQKRISRLFPDPHGDLLAYSYVSSRASGNHGNAPSVKVTNNLMILDLIIPKRDPAPYRMTYHVGIIRWNAKGGRLLEQRRWRWAQWMPKTVWVDGSAMVLLHGLTSFQSSLVDVKTGKAVHLRIPGNWTFLLASSGGRIAAASTMSHNFEEGGKGLRIFIRGRTGRIHTASVGRPALITGMWVEKGHRLIAQIVSGHLNSLKSTTGTSLTGLVEVNWSDNKVLRTYDWPNGVLGGWSRVCSVDSTGNRAICVAQTLRDPPSLVSIDLGSGVMCKLGYLRSGARRLDFKFRRLIIRNTFGQLSSGYLALPKGWRDHGVPLAVMTYGFDRAYSRYAQWITSYPVAKLVHAGIAVLLLNFPRQRPWAKGDFAAAFREVVKEPMSTVENAVSAVRQVGVTVTRAMIMGWSRGGLVAAFAIQRLHQFVAAQVGDPQEWTITSFSLGSATWRRFLTRELGGAPDRRYIGRYLDFDPVSDGRPAKGPILFEFVRRNIPEGQFLQEWRAAGTDVEAFAYRNSDHWLNVPVEAKISRERNLDWAKLNLLGPKSVTSAELRRVGLTVPVNGWWSRGESRRADRR